MLPDRRANIFISFPWLFKFLIRLMSEIMIFLKSICPDWVFRSRAGVSGVSDTIHLVNTLSSNCPYVYGLILFVCTSKSFSLIDQIIYFSILHFFKLNHLELQNSQNSWVQLLNSHWSHWNFSLHDPLLSLNMIFFPVPEPCVKEAITWRDLVLCGNMQGGCKASD